MFWLNTSRTACSSPIREAHGSAVPTRHQWPSAPILSEGQDLSIYTPEDLARAEKLLNSRPRKILGGVHPT